MSVAIVCVSGCSMEQALGSSQLHAQGASPHQVWHAVRPASGLLCPASGTSCVPHQTCSAPPWSCSAENLVANGCSACSRGLCVICLAPVVDLCHLQTLQQASLAIPLSHELKRLSVQCKCTSFHGDGCPIALQECRHCNAQGVALEALQRSPELGVVPSVKRFQTVMAWFAQQRAVDNCCR